MNGNISCAKCLNTVLKSLTDKLSQIYGTDIDYIKHGSFWKKLLPFFFNSEFGGHESLLFQKKTRPKPHPKNSPLFSKKQICQAEATNTKKLLGQFYLYSVEFELNHQIKPLYQTKKNPYRYKLIIKQIKLLNDHKTHR